MSGQDTVNYNEYLNFPLHLRGRYSMQLCTSITLINAGSSLLGVLRIKYYKIRMHTNIIIMETPLGKKDFDHMLINKQCFILFLYLLFLHTKTTL